VELLSSSSISLFLIMSESTSSKGINNSSRDFDSIFHNIVDNSFHTRGGSLGSFIEIERFFVVVFEISTGNHSLKTDGLSNGSILVNIKFPRSRADIIPETAMFSSAGITINEERNNGLGSISGNMVDLEFSTVIRIIDEMFLGEFENGFVGLQGVNSTIRNVINMSKITKKFNFMSVKFGGHRSRFILEFKRVIIDLFRSLTGESNRGLIFSFLTLCFPRVLG